MKHARILSALGVFLLALALFWYGGVDFLQRGFVPAWSLVTSLWVAFLVWWLPGWRK